MKLIFFDTEFTDLAVDPKLISIGLISEDGAMFYAELNDTYDQAQCSDFVVEAVLPHLEGGARRISEAELALRLGNWIEGLGDPVQLVTDSTAWDWPWIQELFSLPGVWPANLDGKPVNILNLVDADRFDQVTEDVFALNPQLRRHHALDDAVANRLAYLEIMQPLRSDQ